MLGKLHSFFDVIEYAVGNVARFVTLVLGGVEVDFIAVSLICPEIFAFAAAVVLITALAALSMFEVER